jgi:3-hydroxyanthranilate 3,4-dioxygenase
VEGDIVLRVLEQGRPTDIPIREGEIFLLPPKVPHSPQRPAGTIGMVLERRRLAHELDTFAWFCPVCHDKLYSESFHLTDIVAQLKPVFDRFYANPKNQHCGKCDRETITRPEPRPSEAML